MSFYQRRYAGMVETRPIAASEIPTAQEILSSLIAPQLRSKCAVAEMLRRITYAQHEDDVAASSILERVLRKANAFAPVSLRPTFTQIIDNFETFESLVWSSKWAASGFPVVKPTDRLAASLMATTLPSNIDGTVQPPWKAFAVMLPSFVEFDDPFAGTDRGLWVEVLCGNHLRVQYDPSARYGWFLRVRGEKGTVLHMVRGEHTLFDESSPEANEQLNAEPFSVQMSNRDHRALELVTRLVGGICLELSDPARLLSSRRGKGHSRCHRETGAPPEPRVYELARAVMLDVRNDVKDFLSGKRRNSPTVQVLVRGHWKMQAHGPRGELRKAIHVEPYWRGPELAPVLGKVS